MKNKGFMRSVLLGASLLGCCGIASAQSIIAEAVDENGFRGVIFENLHRATQTIKTGFRIEAPDGIKFVKGRQQAFRQSGVDIIARSLEGVRSPRVKASYNANFTKATLGNVLQSTLGTGIENVRIGWRGKVRLSNGEEVIKSGIFLFEGLPGLSNSNISMQNRGCRVQGFSGVAVSIANGEAKYNAEKKRIEITATVDGDVIVSSEDFERQKRACELNTPVRYTIVTDLCSIDESRVFDRQELVRKKQELALQGCANGCGCTAGLLMREARDCNAYVNQMLQNNQTSCGAMPSFTPEINGVIPTTNLSTYFSGSPTSDQIVPLMAESASGRPLCTGGEPQKARYFINVQGKSGDGDGIYIPHFFKDGVAQIKLRPSSKIRGSEYVSRWDRLACTSGNEVALSLAIPAELQEAQ